MRKNLNLLSRFEYQKNIMQIPYDPDEWLENYPDNAEKEKVYNYLLETFKRELPSEFVEEINFKDSFISLFPKLDKNKEHEKIIKLLDIIHKNNKELVKKSDFYYAEKYKIDIRAFKQNITKADLRYFEDDYIDSFDSLLPLLIKLVLYNYHDVIDDFLRKIYSDIKNTSKLREGAESKIGYFINNNRWQQIYDYLKKGVDINKEEIISDFADYDFDYSDNFDKIIGYLTGVNKIAELEIIKFEKKHEYKTEILNKLKYSFLRYMYDQKNICFSASWLIWHEGLNCILGRDFNLKEIDTLNDVFSMNKNIFEENVFGYVAFVNNRANTMMGVLWGLPYLYDYLHDNKVIETSVYNSALKIIESLKEEVFKYRTNELWKYNFVHQWLPPDSISRKVFNQEQELFKKSFTEKINSSNFNFKHLKPKSNSSRNRKFKNKDVGRNDPCPCGSGKKYKKCCGR